MPLSSRDKILGEPLMRSLVFTFALALGLAVPAFATAPPGGVVEGRVTLDGRPLAGLEMAFVNVGTGALKAVRSEGDGRFTAQLQPGRYVVAPQGAPGLTVTRAPAQIEVASRGTVLAEVEVAPIPGAPQETSSQNAPAAAAGAPQIDHRPITCFIAGQFPQVDATVVPPAAAASVTRGRVYFKSGRDETLYFVEMSLSEGRYVGKLPRPRLAASPIRYYLEFSTTSAGDLKTPELAVKVVSQGADCEEGGRIAEIGPGGEVTVFSAATGAAVTPAGFAAGGLALTVGSLGLVAGGAAAAGVSAAVNVTPPEPPAPPQTTLPTVPPAPPTPPATPFPVETCPPEPCPEDPRDLFPEGTRRGRLPFPFCQCICVTQSPLCV